MQVLNKNGYQQSLISKACKGIMINHNLPQAQHQMQITDIQSLLNKKQHCLRS